MSKGRYIELEGNTTEKVSEAVLSILSGACTRVDVSKTIKVYECKNVVRIDLKITELPEES